MGSKKQAEVPQFSKAITDFCQMADSAIKDYEYSTTNIKRMDGLTQDYLHMLELDGLDYKERAKVATHLMKCRQERRACKDTVEVLDPLVQFLNSEKGRQLMNLVKDVLGKTRKVEERMETRVYYPRVLKKDEEI